MIIGVVYKDGVEVRRGICTGGKKWAESYPEQYIYITQDNINAEEEKYLHGDGWSYQELQDNGNGWEVVYDSNEKIDRTVDYPLPDWFTNGGAVPKHEHKMNSEGTIDTKHVGYYK